jgi:hypothetical protein
MSSSSLHDRLQRLKRPEPPPGLERLERELLANTRDADGKIRH